MARIEYADLGAICGGSRRPEDLIPAFAAELDYQLSRQPRRFKRSFYRSLVRKAPGALLKDEDFQATLLGRLEYALMTFTPDGAYFGTLPGDGACFGYWPDWDYINSGDVPHFPAGTHDFAGYEGCAVLVTDHGNVSFGTVAGNRFHEAWSVV